MSTSTPTPTRGQLTDPQHMRDYLAGKHAIFTLESTKTGKHFTYSLVALKGSELLRRVRVLSGPDEWAYIGMWTLSRPQLSGPCALTPAQVGFIWFVGHLYSDQLNPEMISSRLEQVQFFHEGACSRCGRSLTNPESIKRGLGPICASRA